MRKFLIGVTLMSLLIVGCGQITSGNDLRTTISNNTVSSGDVNALKFTIPSDAEVKSMTVSVSILPGSTNKSFTNATDKAAVDQILTWLTKSLEVGLEKPPIGMGGYPPTLEIVLNNGNAISIGPAQNWSSKKLANGSTDISGTNAVGYVAMATRNGHDFKVVRLYSPELYKWIVNHEWE